MKKYRILYDTGKTYASAFAVRELGFKRVLVLVHRNQIAKQAMASFERVFGSKIKTGLVSGHNKLSYLTTSLHVPQIIKFF